MSCSVAMRSSVKPAYVIVYDTVIYNNIVVAQLLLSTVYICIYMCIYIYIYIHIHIHMYIYIYIYTRNLSYMLA